MASDHDIFAAFIESPDDIEVLHVVANQLNLKNYEVIVGGIKEAILLYQEKKSPAYLIIDISKSDLPISDMARLLEVCSPNVNIIAVGSQNEIGIYRDLSRLGIYEYLLSPLFSEILERTLHNMISGQSNTAGPTKTGKIIACMGARGGVGTTFVAANIAAMFAGEKSRRVVLVDLDPYFGSLTLSFGIQPNVGLKDAFENPGRIDQVLIDRMLTPIQERLFILASEQPLHENVIYKPEGLEVLLKYLAKQFHYVVVDVPHAFNDLVRTIILKAEIMLLLSEPSVVGLRDAGKLLRFLNTEGGTRRCILGLNKWGQYGKSELHLDEFENIIKSKVNHLIPYNNMIPMDFINQGKLLVNEENPLAESVRNIMFDILGIRETKEKVGWFKKLF